VAFRLSLKPTFPGIGVKSPVSGIDVSEPGVRLQSSGDNQERRSAMFVVHGDRCQARRPPTGYLASRSSALTLVETTTIWKTPALYIFSHYCGATLPGLTIGRT
jgi:hypothetical protein